ncbi:4825_t:CDS:2, partial [Dentiscutata heterogama]
GCKLIIWRKLELLRARLQKDHKSKLFEEIEAKLLHNNKNRTVRAKFQMQDKKKHEWVLVNKENDETIVSKISKKQKSKVLIDYWVKKKSVLGVLPHSNQDKTMLKPLVLEEVVEYKVNTKEIVVSSTEEEVA